jgi:RNA polymerase sigma factor (TIGR02999 family)
VEPSLSSLLASAEGGDRSALDALFATLYSELHRLARRQLSRGAGGMTLGTTTLLHEAYLDMAEREGGAFPDRGRFMAYAARVMRGLIIDYSRSRQAHKRGGQF